MLRRFRPTPRRLAVLFAAAVGIGSGVAYAASLSVNSWHLWAGSQTLTKAQCTLTGTASTTDTYVVQATPNTPTSSTATTMLVKSNSTSQDWSFVRFDLSSCAIPATGGADSATLTLFITTAPATSRTLTVAPVLATWSNTLTWNQAQSLSYGSPTTTLITGTTGNTAKSVTVTVDVDALIKSSSANFGWRISDSGSGNATTTFATSHNGNASRRPTLVINYEK